MFAKLLAYISLASLVVSIPVIIGCEMPFCWEFDHVCDGHQLEFQLETIVIHLKMFNMCFYTLKILPD